MPSLANRAAVLAFRAHGAGKTSASRLAAEAYNDVIEEFSKIASALKIGDDDLGLTELDAEGLEDVVWADQSLHEAVDGFVVQAYFVYAQLSGPARADDGELMRLAELTSGSLFASLETATHAVQAKIADLARAEQEKSNHARDLTINTVSKLNDVTRSIQMIAINASIEAGRAGEAGRGFYVIANEIRELSSDAQAAVDSVSKGLQQLGPEA
ncbi:MAG: methyl-accepting chemotaxis protein [Pseudomonadota bacterium]